MNTFEDWQVKNDKPEDIELNQRAKELGNLVSIDRERALTKVMDSQEKQKKAQDKRHTILDDRLLTGTSVFLKKEGLLSKLEPRYTGPYKIIGHTRL
jgi:hypothetical protein